MRVRGLKSSRVPASLAEARAMVDYNERILATSQSSQRRQRAERMLGNVRAELARLTVAARPAAKRVAARATDEYVAISVGSASLTDACAELERQAGVPA